MLGLVRKYQKSLFLVVTVMLVASFLFFGISSSVHSQQKEKDWVYGTAIDGSSISGLEINRLSKFLASDISDLMIFEKRATPNLFNDGALKSEIIDTGVAHELYVRFEEELKEDLNQRYQKFRAFTPYEHPQKIIGVLPVWKQYGGESHINDHWGTFKSLDGEINEKAFDTLLNLYSAQKQLPPGIVRQILLYQQYQYAEMLQADNYLQTGDLAIFNSRSFADWFGPQLLDLSAAFIYNADIRAKKLGYKVSMDEARASLIENIMKGIKQVEPNRNVTKEEFTRYMQKQLAMLNLSEDQAAKVWQKVLTTRRWLDDAGTGVFVDQELYRSYFDYAYKGAKVEHYKLPDSINFQSVDDMLKFEIYLDLIGTRENPLDMPTEFYSIEEMKSRAPKLLQKRFIVDVSSKEKDEIAVCVSLKESLDWQLEEGNWKTLVENFPVLSTYNGKDLDQKHEFISKLAGKDRSLLDSFVRSSIIEEHPEMILESLAQAKKTTQEIMIPLNKSGNILRNLTDHQTLLHLLETAMHGNELTSEMDVESAIKLSCYSEDNNMYYSIRLIDRDADFHVMTFEQAKHSGVLDQLFGEKLRAEYTRGRFKEDYDEAIPKLKNIVFNQIFEEIEMNAGKSEEDFESIDLRHNFAKKNRMAYFMSKRLEEAKEGKFAPSKGKEIFSEKDFLKPLRSLEDSWKPLKEEISVTRISENLIFDNSLFDMCASTWSGVVVETGNGPNFYKVLDSFIDTSHVESRVKKGREFLSQEARNLLLSEFLDEAIEKKSILIIAEKEDQS